MRAYFWRVDAKLCFRGQSSLFLWQEDREVVWAENHVSGKWQAKNMVSRGNVCSAPLVMHTHKDSSLPRSFSVTVNRVVTQAVKILYVYCLCIVCSERTLTLPWN